MRLVVGLPMLLLLCSSTLHAAEAPPLGDQAAAWAAGLGHGAVATAEKRDGRWSFALGGKPFAEGREAVPAEKVLFEIGSISKVFTGILLAQSVVEGKLSLDDTLAKSLPVTFADPAVGALTLRQIATHSSCLPRLPANMMNADGKDPYAAYDDRALFEYLAAARLDGKPPCTAEYSNLGYGVLGVVLERAHGEPWATLVQKRIATPLGMIDTVQALSKEQEARLAAPWDGDQPAQSWTFKAMAGAGALRSTLADMSRLADALLAGKEGPLGAAWPLVAGDYVDFPSSGGKLGLALLHGKVGGEDTYSHDGGTGGYRSSLTVSPAAARAIVVLASNAKAMPEAWLASSRAAGTTPVARMEIVLTTEALDEYAGVYPIDASAKFTVVRHGDGLVVKLTGQGYAPIVASAKDEFFYKVVDAQISFRRDAAGKIDGLILHQNGRDIPATRAAGPPPKVDFPTAAALAEYVGDYDFGAFMPGATISVKSIPAALTVQLTGQPALPVFGVERDRFAYDVVEAALTFERDPAGKVVAVVLHQSGMDMRAPRK